MSVPLALVSTRHEYDHVFSIYVPIAIGVFVLFAGSIVVAALWYRRRPPSAVSRRHENNALEGGYAVVLALIVAFLLYVTFTAEHQTDVVSAHERPSVTINVTASKWEWTFRYPRGRIERSGTVGHQPLVVPAGTAVRFNLSSVDVIHALWIPEVDYKHDLIPGSTQRITLDFSRTGTFSGECAEYCGLRHADMVFTVRVLTPAQFAAWTSAR